MPDEKLLQILKEGVPGWNAWHKKAWRQNSNYIPDLRYAKLPGADLRKAGLYDADLRSADLTARLKRVSWSA
jgi:uncharacterized protein YjbI with pentapeptide repeats